MKEENYILYHSATFMKLYKVNNHNFFQKHNKTINKESSNTKI